MLGTSKGKEGSAAANAAAQATSSHARSEAAALDDRRCTAAFGADSELGTSGGEVTVAGLRDDGRHRGGEFAPLVWHVNVAMVGALKQAARSATTAAEPTYMTRKLRRSSIWLSSGP